MFCLLLNALGHTFVKNHFMHQLPPLAVENQASPL